MGNSDSRSFSRRMSFGRSSFKGTYNPVVVGGVSLTASQRAKETKLQLDRYWIGASAQNLKPIGAGMQRCVCVVVELQTIHLAKRFATSYILKLECLNGL